MTTAETGDFNQTAEFCDTKYFDNRHLSPVENIDPLFQAEGQVTHGVAHIAGAEVRYTLELPPKDVGIIDEVSDLIIPGFGGIESTYANYRHQTAKRGKPAITIRPVRLQKSLAARVKPSNFSNPGLLPSQAIYGVMREVDRTNQGDFNTELYDLEGHSLGGWVGAQTAEAKPTRVRTLRLIAPVGVTTHDHDSMKERMPLMVANEVIPMLRDQGMKNSVQAALHTIDYLFRNPQRTLAEAKAASNFNMAPVLERLGDTAVRTSITLFHSDILFPPNELREEAAAAVDVLSTYPDTTYGHLAPQNHPEEVAMHQAEINRELLQKHAPTSDQTHTTLQSITGNTRRRIRKANPFTG